MNEEQNPQAEPHITPPPVEENWKEKYLLSIAEMENMRKRMQKERSDMSRFAIESAIADFLPAIDNFENALRFAGSGSAEIKNWATGFEMILSQFKEVLNNNGIHAFNSVGSIFNPHDHEAVEMVETNEKPDGTILEEFTKGYKSSLRTIRPARVKVAKHIARDAEEQNLNQ